MLAENTIASNSVLVLLQWLKYEKLTHYYVIKVINNNKKKIINECINGINGSQLAKLKRSIPDMSLPWNL